jgi:uncharacterized phage-like protein YoqJ
MRIGISGPRNWKSVEKYKTTRAALAKSWLSVQLDAACIQGNIEAVTSLQLGLDTYFAALCESKGIPFKVFLACNDQDKFWDEEARETFRYLLSKAESIECVSSDEYRQGCISKQTKAITNWLIEEDDSRLLIVKHKILSKAQQERKKALEEVIKIITYTV